jgi:predicted DNA-binding ribbon-helix-helix protein
MKRFSVIIARSHTTSISLEVEFYRALRDLAKEQGISMNQLITQIDSTRATPNLSSALRLYVLQSLQQKIADLK